MTELVNVKALRDMIRQIVREEQGCGRMPADYREGKGLDVPQLAAKVGISAATLHNWEGGRVDNINHRTLSIHMRQVALALGVSIEEYRASVQRAIAARKAA